MVETAKYAMAQGHQKVLLLGTKFTMEDGFFADLLRFFGLDVSVPDEKDRRDIQTMQSAISAGRMQEDFKARFADILMRYQDNDAVILGCTELPLAITPEQTTLPIINPIHAQCDAAVKMVLAYEPDV